MKKAMRLTAIFFMFTMLLSTFALAAGTSTRDTITATDSDTNDEYSDNAQEDSTHSDCADLEERRERIKCRLKERIGEYSEYDTASFPEACRKLGTDSKEECRKLYNRLQPCYRQEGRLKDICFRRVAGIGTAAISVNSDKTHIRNYVVSLLYDLQERIEEQVDLGNAEADEAAEAIDLIVEIKEEILSGATKAQIRPMLAELKSLMRDLRS